MTIEIASYNIEEASIDVAELLLKTHPGKTRKWYAEQLGCSERTLYRWVTDGRLQSVLFRTKVVENAIQILQRAGYTVTV